jgi:two-component system LytT family response regulator
MNPKTTALIIDDEQAAREVLTGLLQKFPEIEIVAQAEDVDSGIISFLKHKPDIVFLDVQMPKKDGFEFINHLQDYLIHTSVIFITAYHKFAIEAIRHSAFDFLLKPINQKELNETIKRYHKTKNRNNLQLDIQQLLSKLNEHKKIKLNTRGGFELIYPDDILYLDANGRYTNIYCVQGKNTLSTFLLKEIEDLLTVYTYFVRINRSVIINKNYLSSFDRIRKKCILYSNNQSYEFKISRSRLKEFEERI